MVRGVSCGMRYVRSFSSVYTGRASNCGGLHIRIHMVSKPRQTLGGALSIPNREGSVAEAMQDNKSDIKVKEAEAKNLVLKQMLYKNYLGALIRAYPDFFPREWSLHLLKQI